jgi:hypothetical protein
MTLLAIGLALVILAMLAYFFWSMWKITFRG